MNEAAIAHVLSITADPYPHPDYRVCRNEDELGGYFDSFDPTGEHEIEELGADTEETPDKEPYCVTLSHTPGTARLVYAKDYATIKELARIISVYGLATEEEFMHQLFHNYLHDEIAYGKLNLPIGPFTDTLVRAYNLCLGGGGDNDGESRAGRGSLGLKVLAYRHLNVEMTSFRETVYPYSIPKMMDWLRVVGATFAPVEYEPVCVCGCPTADHKLGKTGKPSGGCNNCGSLTCIRHKKGKPVADPNDRLYGLLCRKANNLIKALLDKEKPGLWDTQYYEEEDEADIYSLVDPWKRIKDWHDHDRQFVRDFGLWPPPPASVADVPEPQLLQYACRDADVTLRLYLYMKNLKPWIFY